MIVDTSAILAIALDEPERVRFRTLIAEAQRCALSAGSWIELSAVVTRRHPDSVLAAIGRLIAEARITIAPVTIEQAQIGHEAYRVYGKGRHPARLNFGDCFAYALAKATGEPLLYKGDDFVHTDVRAAA